MYGTQPKFAYLEAGIGMMRETKFNPIAVPICFGGNREREPRQLANVCRQDLRQQNFLTGCDLNRQHGLLRSQHPRRPKFDSQAVAACLQRQVRTEQEMARLAGRQHQHARAGVHCDFLAVQEREKFELRAELQHVVTPMPRLADHFLALALDFGDAVLKRCDQPVFLDPGCLHLPEQLVSALVFRLDPLGLPSVTVIVEPLITIVDAAPVAPNVRFPVT